MNNIEALQTLSISLAVVIMVIVATLVTVQWFWIPKLRSVEGKAIVHDIRAGLIIALLIFSFSQLVLGMRLVYLGS